MKRNLLSWVSTLMLLFLGLAQVAQAQAPKTDNDIRISLKKATNKAKSLGKLDKGLVALRFEVNALKNDNIENVFIQLPDNGGLIAPIGFYASNTGKRYRVTTALTANNNLLPSRFKADAKSVVRFAGIGGIKTKSKKKGKTEQFEIVLSEAEYLAMGNTGTGNIHIAVETSKDGIDNIKRVGYVAFGIKNEIKLQKEYTPGAATSKTISTLATCSTPVIQGVAKPCPGEVVEFTIPLTAGNSIKSISWEVPSIGSDGLPSNWELVSSSGTNVAGVGMVYNKIKVKVGDISNTIYASVNMGTCGTQVVSFATYLGDEIPVSISTVNGDKDGNDEEVFEAGDLMIFNANANQGRDRREYVYNWSIPTGWTVFAGQGTSQLIVIAGSAEGFVEVDVKSKSMDARYCGLGYAYVELVQENGTCPGPTIVVDTPDKVCEGGVYKLSVVNPDPNQKIKYQFFVPDGAEIVSEGYGYAYVRILELPADITELAFTVVAVNANNCGATDVCVKIPVGDCPDTACETLTPPSLIVPDQLCNIRNFEFTLTGMQDGVTYDFEFPEGFVIDSFDPETGKLSVDIVFDENTMLPTQQTLVVIATNECGESVAYEREVTVSDCEGGNPLPVTLTRFEGASRSGSVELAWSTASEINNDRFEIERSANGKEFKKVGEVKGNGNSVVLVDYTYTDRSAASGTVYYRLKQVDFDGQSEYSKVIAVNHTASASNASLSVYPNPVENGKVNLRFQEQVDGTTTIRLTDMSGRVLHTQEARNVGAEHELNLTGLNLKAGIYMISVTANGQSTTQRIMVR